MKLRYFLTSIVACLALAIGCTKEELPGLSEIQVTPSYFTFGVDGGAKEITLTAVADWTVSDVPEWLTVSPASGSATDAEGVKVTVTAAPTTSEKVVAATIKFNCAGKSQLVTVGQEAYVPDYPKFKAGEYWIMFAEEVAVPVSSSYGYLYTAKANKSEDGKLSSTADNIFTFTEVEGGFSIQDAAGKFYAMKGTYTSFNLYDTAQESYVYTVKQTGDDKFVITNANGKVMQYDPAYSSAGAYDSEKTGAIYPNLVSVAGAEIAEILFAVEPTEVALEQAEGEFNINMTCKNDAFEINPSADWITVKGMTSTNGEYVVTFSYEANDGGARTAAIDFISAGETITVAVSQEGSVIDATVAEFLAAEEGATLYRVKGVVKSVSVSAQYHNASVTILGGSGEELDLYRLVASEGNIEDVKFGVGSLVTVVGARSSYNGKPQMAAGCVLESFENFTAKTVAEFIAAEEGDAVYAVTGEIVGIKDLSESYNNVGITIKDGDAEVLLYRVKTFDGTNVTKLNLTVGGTVTVAGKRSSYNGTPQMAAGGLLLNYVAPATGEEGGETPVSGKYVKVTAEQSDWSGKYLIVFGSNAHATLASSGKDLNSTVAVNIVNGEIAASAELAPAVMTVTKNGDKYMMTFADGKYFGMQKNGCKLMTSPFDLNFAYTTAGPKISGFVTSENNTFILYENASSGTKYYRCYVEKNGQTGYNLPALFKYTE